jgi:hypothetical protein
MNIADTGKTNKFSRFLVNNVQYLILFTYLIVGSIILPDYGISTDEPIQRKHGIVSFDYINQKFNIFPGIQPTYEESLPDYDYRDYGVAFQVFSYGMEKLLKIEDARSVFLIRHFLTFMLFWISAYYFYKTAEITFDNKLIPVLGLLFYILSPRIFTEAFYNPKDIILLSWISIGIYSMLKFLEVRSFRYLFIHALVCSLAINARIVGIVLPFVTVLVALLSLRGHNFLSWIKSIGIILLLWGVLTIVFTILLWPFLWEDPVRSFIYSFNGMKRFRWDGQLLYWGKLVWASELPWHYTLSQILVTTPVLYSILFLIGFFCTLTTVAKRRFLKLKSNCEKNSIAFLLLFIIPLISVIYFHSILYNGWRQMYFIYPAILLVSLIGLENLFRLILLIKDRLKRMILLSAAYLAIVISLSSTAYFLVNMHPFQYIYFNRLAGADPLRNFDGDYFGLSYKTALNYLANNFTDDSLKIFSTNSSCSINSLNFVKPVYDRLVFVDDIQGAEFFITTYYFPASSGKYEDNLLNKYPFNQRSLYRKQFRKSTIVGIYQLNKSY